MSLTTQCPAAMSQVQLRSCWDQLTLGLPRESVAEPRSDLALAIHSSACLFTQSAIPTEEKSPCSQVAEFSPALWGFAGIGPPLSLRVRGECVWMPKGIFFCNCMQAFFTQ